jgi:Phage terminase large subunit
MRQLEYIDLFPSCMLPHCPDRDSGDHAHILPHQQTILDCDTKYLYCQGGVGSAKSLAFAVKCVWLSLTLPNNKGVVSRLHYDDLFDSSWKEIKECLDRLVEKGLIPVPQYTKKVQGDYTEITLHNGSEIKAIQGKNWSRGLGASHGWFWVDDAMESQSEFFVGTNTSAGLLSRLRLPHVHFNSRTYSEEHRPHGSLHGMVSSNPPHYDHWLHKLFGEKPGVKYIGEDSVTWMQVATSDNPFVGADYAKGLIAVQHQLGHDMNTAKRIIFGESERAYKGVPVFPQFTHALHVAPLKFRSDLPLIRSWDFGYHHPSVIFSNIYQCSYKTNHYFTLSEVSDAFNLTVYQLYENYVKPHTEKLYKNAVLIKDCGDNAGYRESSANRDRRSDMKILIHEYKLPFKWRFTSLRPSLQYMRGLLQPKEQCQCGLPLILISEKCKVLIGALEGGYRFSKNRQGVIGDKPVEDKLFADTACAWRYGAENYVKWGLEWDEQKELTQITRVRNYPNVQAAEHQFYNWLNEADSKLAERMNPGYNQPKVSFYWDNGHDLEEVH